MDQICFAFKIYKFSTIEEAVSIMMKDPESKLYQHRYYNMSGVCAICSGRVSEHEVNLDNTAFIKDEEVVLDVTDRKLFSDRSQIINKISRTNNVQKLNKVEIVLPMETMVDFDDPLICQICFAEKLKQDPIVMLECNHKYCNNCIVKYLENKIKDGNVLNIKCLYPNCMQCFSNENIKHVVSTYFWIKYKKFLLQKLKMNQDSIKLMNCPFPDCEEIVEIDPYGMQIFVECASNHKFCSMCQECEWHQVGKCNKVKLFLILV
jgi:hypothetical protein